MIQRGYIDKGEYELINGRGVVSGKLIGGCLETLNNLRGTDLFPSSSTFKNTILFIENSGSLLITLLIIEQNIRTLGYLGILKMLMALSLEHLQTVRIKKKSKIFGRK